MIDKLEFIGELQIVGRCLGAAVTIAVDLRGADSRGRLSLQSSEDFSLTVKYEDGTAFEVPQMSNYFPNFIKSLCKFFKFCLGNSKEIFFFVIV